MDLIVWFVVRNLVTQKNFIEFRDKRNFTFFETTGVGQHMASHVGDTWQAMCHNAWQRLTHVGHMASHVCDTWHVGHMAHGVRYKWGVGAVCTSRKQQEGKGRKKQRRRGKERKEKREKKREREGEEREREIRRKGKRCSEGWNSSYQEVKSVYSTRAALQEAGFLLLRFMSHVGA